MHVVWYLLSCLTDTACVCVPDMKLLPDDTYEPLMVKNPPFLNFDVFVLSHFPEQDGTLQ